MIADAAIEAAAKVLYLEDHLWHEPWEIAADAGKYRMNARVALEAAAPHMLAGAWDDAYEKGRDRGEWEAAPVTEEPTHANPYKEYL